jgi:hypothetical protein
MRKRRRAIHYAWGASAGGEGVLRATGCCIRALPIEWKSPAMLSPVRTVLAHAFMAFISMHWSMLHHRTSGLSTFVSLLRQETHTVSVKITLVWWKLNSCLPSPTIQDGGCRAHVRILNSRRNLAGVRRSLFSVISSSESRSHVLCRNKKYFVMLNEFWNNNFLTWQRQMIAIFSGSTWPAAV